MPAEDNFPPEPVPRRRSPAGQALAVMVIALLVASLLNGERLDYTAHTQPYGWQRTWAVRITGPLAAVSRATGLSKARELMAQTAGPCANPENAKKPVCTNEIPKTTTEDVELARPTPTEPDGTPSPTYPDGTPTTSTSSSTTTTTAPPRVPTAADPLRILVAGDSLMGWIGPALKEELDGAPINVIEDWEISTGLARPDKLNWPVQLEQDMAAHDPEVVVVGFGGNDAQDLQTADGNVTMGTKEWETEYQRRVVQVLDALEKPGRTVYWVGLPITTRSDIEKAAPAMTAAVKREISVRPWAHFVDSRKALTTKEGKYADYLPDATGRPVKVREADGVHPNVAGAGRIVRTFTEQLAEERNLPTS